MLEQIYRWLQNIAVYLIVTTALLHTVPGKHYEKYIRFFSSLVLIVLLFMPLLSVFGARETFGMIYENREYEKDKEEIEKAGQIYEKTMTDYCEKETEKVLEEKRTIRDRQSQKNRMGGGGY